MLTENDTTEKKRGLRIVTEHLSSVSLFLPPPPPPVFFFFRSPVIKEVFFFFSVRFMDDQFQIDYVFLLFPLFNFL